MFGKLERRTAALTLKLTNSERRELEAAARARGIALSELTRQALGEFLSKPIAGVQHDHADHAGL